MNEERDLNHYMAALETLRWDADRGWNVFSSFLLAHTIFVGLMLQNGLKLKEYELGPFVAGIVGFLLCIPWGARYYRHAKYFKFRCAQVREAEPKDWNLIAGKGRLFSEGKFVEVDKMQFGFCGIAKLTKGDYSVWVFIGIFAMLYFIVTVFKGPWW